ncbi:MAG: class I SAM-dependent methyltransferase [Bacteroidia bacterium]|nr:class I SAM-dependent methyltransferase [Bacteroidia bacterium]
MELLCPDKWTDYELIDSGNFEKLERFGKYITIRPEPQAVWDKKLSSAEWEKTAHVKFISKSSSSGTWKKLKTMPDQWIIEYKSADLILKFRLGLTSFKHVGIFPEQSVNWKYIYHAVKKMKMPQPRALNLFAYTGGASLAAKRAGADVVHVDSIKQVVTWSKENMDLNRLSNIRWIVEDAMTFVKREIKRGNTYHCIILDPPAFGHGPSGESWKLERDINGMIKNVLALLDEKEHFFIINTYSLGFSALILENLLKENIPATSKLSIGELYLQAKTGTKLPLGVFGRFCNIKN